MSSAAAALKGLAVIVVDDASEHPDVVTEVARCTGARVLRLDVNLGPSGARNAGLTNVTTPYVAFVDSDVVVTPEQLMALVPHFNDPLVALVGPQVIGRIRDATTTSRTARACRRARSAPGQRYQQHPAPARSGAAGTPGSRPSTTRQQGPPE